MKPLLDGGRMQSLVETLSDAMALPPIVEQVSRMIEADETDLQEIARIIRFDPGLSAKVLALANSDAYGRKGRVDSLPQAVLNIGLRGLRQVLLGLEVVGRLGTESEAERLDTARVWRHSIGCAVLASRLAALQSDVELEEAFMMGLLHDVGQLLLAQRLGRHYDRVLEVSDRLLLPVGLVEKHLLLVDHAHLMARILSGWSVPVSVATAIGQHHNEAEEELTQRYGKTATVLALADRFAQAVVPSDSAVRTLYPTQALCRAIDLSVSAAGAVFKGLSETVDHLLASMLPSLDATSSADEDAHAAGALDRPFRPLFVSRVPELDAVGMFCKRLVKTRGQPTVAIVHIERSDATPTLSKRLLAGEKRAGVHKLPLIVLSDTGERELAPEAMAGRSVRRLAMPVTSRRLLDAVNRIQRPAGAKSAA